MSDSYGRLIRFTIFGESHGAAIGGILDGIVPGTPIDTDFIAAQMEKRRAKGSMSTKRTEPDAVKFASGVYNGCATGSAICFYIENTNTKSGDYAKTAQLLRPGHADYTALIKYGGFADARGGGHFSGRLTAAVTAAGAICQLALRRHGIQIATHIAKCAGVADTPFCENEAGLLRQIKELDYASFPAISAESAESMRCAAESAAQEGDSVGGVLETVIYGAPAGLGEPFFGSCESELAHLLFSMPAVKGVEFGAGFAFADMTGSKANDSFYMDNGNIKTKTNNAAGINGGITNGMPIILRTAVKPTPSIYKAQQTVDYISRENAEITISGRHDPCIVHRAAVVQTSLCALAVADLAAAAGLFRGEA